MKLNNEEPNPSRAVMNNAYIILNQISSNGYASP